MAGAEVRPDATTYNILLDAYTKANMSDKAEDLLRHMQSAKIKPDKVTYNTLMNCYTSVGDLDKAGDVMESMLRRRMRPLLITCGMLLDAYVKAREIEKAEQLLYTLWSVGNIKPNLMMYNILCKGYKLDSQWKKAERVSRKIKHIISLRNEKHIS